MSPVVRQHHRGPNRELWELLDELAERLRKYARARSGVESLHAANYLERAADLVEHAMRRERNGRCDEECPNAWGGGR